MAARIAALLSRPALLRTLASHARLALRLLREPGVPLASKALLAVPLLYVLSPLDIVPDVLPGLGQLDDLGVVMLALELFVRVCPSEIVAHHRQAMDARRPYAPIRPAEIVIDTEFRRG
jgi:uncharacterized membrane protein YkvA (DUF1232 family)